MDEHMNDNIIDSTFNREDENPKDDVKETVNETAFETAAETVKEPAFEAFKEGTETTAYNPIPEEPVKKKKAKAKVKKEKGERKNPNFFVKAFLVLLLGILFGGAAAGSFYAVDRYLKGDTDTSENIETEAPVNSKEFDDIKESVRELQTAILEDKTGIQVTNTAVVTDVTAVVEKVMPAMVSITNVGEVRRTDWFGRVYTEETESYGSGIVIGESDTEYLIATNNHVIENNKSLSVLFADGASADAFVKGYDASVDISVIAVSKEKVSKETRRAITVAELGDSDALRMGEPAIAIGNALGYGQSVTTGVISAVGREITIDGNVYSNLIQTSAAINPGNSGGALLNIYGQVVGINSSKVGSDSIDNMGFAIPINGIRDSLKEFSDREIRDKVPEKDKGYLGIGGNDTYDLTELGYPAGVYVAKVYEGSPAEEAGLFMGDVITKVDGQSVKTISELSSFLDYYRAGEKVKLSVTRNVSGALTELELEVTLGTKDVIAD